MLRLQSSHAIISPPSQSMAKWKCDYSHMLRSQAWPLASPPQNSLAVVLPYFVFCMW